MPDDLQRIYKLKVTILALVAAGIGIALLALARWISDVPGLEWFRYWPLGELGGSLFISGVFVVAYDYINAKDQEERESARLKRVLVETAPAMKDAVIEGFAVGSADLERVATPELLDGIIDNSLALRLGDRQFATEVYADIKQQAIRASERWHDARISIDLAPDPSAKSDRFIVTVSWEYTVVPKHATRSFVCVSDRSEYVEIAQDPEAVSAWYLKPRPGIDASSTDAFELLQFFVDGQPRKIRRSVRKSGQSYSAAIGSDAVERAEPVRVSYTYRTVTMQSGHLLHVDLEHPTRNVSLDIDYADCGIEHMSVLDMISSSRRSIVERSPASIPGKRISVDLDGWVFPRSGVGFVWSLSNETGGNFKGSSSISTELI